MAVPRIYTDEAFEEILRRVAGGERVSRICAEPGQPSELAVLKHRRRDPDFARRWTAAIGRRSGAPVPPIVFERILRRVARGESALAICREPGMPSYEAVRRHRRLDRSFSTRWDDAVGRRRGVRTREDDLDRARIRVALGERLTAVAAEPGMPSLNAIRRARARTPEQAEAWAEALGSRRGAFVDRQPDRMEVLLEAARTGAGYAALDRLIGAKSLIRLTRRDSIFAARYAEARAAGRAIVRQSVAARRLSAEEIWGVVETAIRYVPSYARDDIRGDLMIELLEGRVPPGAARTAVRGLVTAWNRRFGRRDISMDAEAGEGGFNFGGLIADESAFDHHLAGVTLITRYA